MLDSNIAGAVQRLCHAYRVYGWQAARVDPLALHALPACPELHPGFYGITEEAMHVPVPPPWGQGLLPANRSPVGICLPCRHRDPPVSSGY
jgi:2-oxoglutarate dehydrogenase complex dehydrogenase (E1) component-like enzyme